MFFMGFKSRLQGDRIKMYQSKFSMKGKCKQDAEKPASAMWGSSDGCIAGHHYLLDLREGTSDIYQIRLLIRRN